jgi:hypothetical protein
MVMTNWSRLKEYFGELLPHPRHGSHACEMLRLLQNLHQQHDLDDVEITAEYLYINIAYAGMDGCIQVHNERPDLFLVNLRQGNGPSCTTSDETRVPVHYVAPLVLYFLQRMKEAAV